MRVLTVVQEGGYREHHEYEGDWVHREVEVHQEGVRVRYHGRHLIWKTIP